MNLRRKMVRWISNCLDEEEKEYEDEYGDDMDDGDEGRLRYTHWFLQM